MKRIKFGDLIELSFLIWISLLAGVAAHTLAEYL